MNFIKVLLLTLLVSSQAFGAMTHYVNGTSLTPKVYNSGNGYGNHASSEPPEATADLTSINGSTSLDLAGSAYSSHGLIYLGGDNITDGTSKNLSRLTRVKFKSVGITNALNFFGSVGNNSRGSIELFVNSSNELRVYMISDVGLNGIVNGDCGFTVSADVWYDIGYTWNNSTRDLKVYVDGVLEATINSSRSFGTNWNGHSSPQLSLGVGGLNANTHILVDEDVMWDEIVDFTSSGLDTDGASRTTYLSFTATVANTNPGIANVRSGTGYIFGGASLTGTAAIPSADDVRSGTSVDATTGNMTLPAIADVETGVTFGTSGTELTGTLNLPSEDDVRSGTSYNGGGNTGNMTLPAVGDVQSAVTFGTSGTELTGTFGVPTAAQVENGVGFGAGDTEFTGTLALATPNAGDLRDGVIVGAVTGTLEVPGIGDVRSGTQYGGDGTQYTGILSVSGGTTKKSHGGFGL